jgi:hypothetical protein
MVASLLKMAGLEDWPVPDFSALCRGSRLSVSGSRSVARVAS